VFFTNPSKADIMVLRIDAGCADAIAGASEEERLCVILAATLDAICVKE
jgi:hypothetical protein